MAASHTAITRTTVDSYIYHEPLAFVHRVLFDYVFMKALQLCGGESHRYHPIL
jgi:hypothetical protein